MSARTTGDQGEMDDLDAQRRTAPGDQGGTPLPELSAPLTKGKAGIPNTLAVNARLPTAPLPTALK